MVKIKLPLNTSVNTSLTNGYNMNTGSNTSMANIVNGFNLNNSYQLKSELTGLNESLANSINCTPNSSDNAKLWDNDELVMKALRVYGKMPRPQVFNEISRVCKLSNLRKSRYFHEKMMKNNPFKDKIMQLIAEEGEHNYPYFKIFFEEYKTKKQRLSLINNENVADFVPKLNGGNTFSTKLDHSVENSVENSNDYENSCSDQVYYNNDEVCTENYDYHDDYVDNNETDGDMAGVEMNGDHHNNDYNQNNTQFDQTANLDTTDTNHQVQPLVDTNAYYLENLELKLKILNKEKEHMVDYFQTFTTVIDNLKSEIVNAKSDRDTSQMDDDLNDHRLDSTNINTDSLDALIGQLTELNDSILKLKNDSSKFARDQAALREELKVTKNYANVENRKLQDDLDSCKAQLSIKDEEIFNLKKRLDEAQRQNRTASAKHLSIQTTANFSKIKLNEMKENMDRMFAQIQTLV